MIFFVFVFVFFLQDRYAEAMSLPPMDEQQDYELTGFQESGGKTLLKFNRKFDTCDTRDKKLEVNFLISVVIFWLFYTKMIQKMKVAYIKRFFSESCV